MYGDKYLLSVGPSLVYRLVSFGGAAAAGFWHRTDASIFQWIGPHEGMWGMRIVGCCGRCQSGFMKPRTPVAGVSVSDSALPSNGSYSFFPLASAPSVFVVLQHKCWEYFQVAALVIQLPWKAATGQRLHYNLRPLRAARSNILIPCVVVTGIGITLIFVKGQNISCSKSL